MVGVSMLKIRDDFNLKELEKHGFANNINDIWFKRTLNCDDRYKTGFLVNPLNKKIENQIVHYTTTEYPVEIQEDDIDLTSELDTLYDLIKADIVVKE